MKNRTIVAEEIPVEANVMLAGDVRQVRWKASCPGGRLYRVYVNGRLVVVATGQTRHNFPNAAGAGWKTACVEVFVELADEPNQPKRRKGENKCQR
jgi:hypothetical protein